MRVLSLTILLVFALAGNLLAQGLSGLPYNINCASAIQVCTTVNQQFSPGPVEQCNGGVTELYYSFDFPGGTNNSITIGPSSSITGYYVLYGPFQDLNLNNCELILSNSAPFADANEFDAGANSSHTLNPQQGIFILKVVLNSCSGTFNVNVNAPTRLRCSNNLACTECVSSFNPGGGRYIVSAWVHESSYSPSVSNFTNSSIQVSFQGGPTTIYTLTPSGEIIDGWQRIESTIVVPPSASGMDIQLISSSGDSYFDDIRFFPTDGSMMSYVYDPISLRLMAELDERNYATFYEYDEEGKLIRVKKETEKGIMTIQENRDHIIKKTD